LTQLAQVMPATGRLISAGVPGVVAISSGILLGSIQDGHRPDGDRIRR
jgi:hypothetical protein